MPSRSWNRVDLIGNLTRDPELRYTPNGAAVCTFGMATHRTYVTEGERKEEVDFHRLVAWNKLAELCNQLLKKGNKVFVSGRLQTRSWEGQDGAQRQTTDIVVEYMILLTPKNSFDPVSASEDVADIEPVKAEKPETGKKKVKEETETEEQTSEKAAEKAPQEEVNDDLPF